MLGGILANTLFRFAFLIIVLMALLLRKMRSRLEKGIFAFVLLRLVYEVVSLSITGYNLLHYSIFNFIDLVLISWIIFGQTRNKLVLWVSILPIFLVLMFFIFTDYSSVTLFGFIDSYSVVSPIGVHQYFDFCCCYSLMVILLSFYWLNIEVNYTNEKYALNAKSIVFILSFLTFHGGAFFTMAFARLALPESDLWSNMWNLIYLPLYHLFLIGLTIGGLWKRT